MDKRIKISKLFLDSPYSDEDPDLKHHMIRIDVTNSSYTIKVGSYLSKNNILTNHKFNSHNKNINYYDLYKKAYELMIDACPDAILIHTNKNTKIS